MQVGRNDPCPCGSGEKYKRCCLRKDAVPANELIWSRLKKSRQKLVDAILNYAAETYGPKAFEEAWLEFEKGQQLNEDPSLEYPLFMPWFMYHWVPRKSKSSEKNPPALSLIREHPKRLEPLHVEYVLECVTRGMSFYEILSVEPGKGYETEDILTKALDNVVEKSGSIGRKPGEIVFGKLVSIQGLTMFEALSSSVFPPIERSYINELRKDINRVHRSQIRVADLKKYEHEILTFYRAMYAHHVQPKMPRMTNTDGDDLAPVVLRYRLSVKPDEAFKALSDLDGAQAHQEALKQGEFKDGHLVAINFIWNRSKLLSSGEQEFTVLAHLRLEDDVLIVRVNSPERGARFRKLLSARLPRKTKLIDSRPESLQNYEGQMNARKSVDLSTAELAALIEQKVRAHWAQWIHEKIPALNGRTPIQASKTKPGRELLEALLLDLQLSVERNPQFPDEPQVIKDIRKKLGV